MNIAIRLFSQIHAGQASLAAAGTEMQKPRLRGVFQFGGEGGIRTLDTLPYTHFPGVLLQPLGHLTKLFHHEAALYALNRDDGRHHSEAIGKIQHKNQRKQGVWLFVQQKAQAGPQASSVCTATGSSLAFQ